MMTSYKRRIASRAKKKGSQSTVSATPAMTGREQV